MSARDSVFLAVLFFLLTPGWQSCAADNNHRDQRNAAEELVRTALDAEVQGNPELRDQLLQKALLVDPEYQPARWHSGQVKLDGQWHTVREIDFLAASDQRLQQYQQLRAASWGTLEDQIAIAQWCHKCGLEYYSKRHWLNVLQLAPAHPAALRALDVAWFDGQLLSREEIERRKRAHRAARHAMRQWKDRLHGWIRDIEGDDAAARHAALSRLRAISDPRAIPALETYISSKSNREPELLIEVISAIGRMKDHSATISLARHAVLSHHPDAQNVACMLLKERPLHDYVPILLNEMVTPLELSGTVKRSGSTGGVESYYRLFRKGWQAEYEKTVTVDDRRNSRIFHESWLSGAEIIRQNVARANEATARWNHRISYVLAQTTGENYEADPESWWDWWRDYNEYAEYGKPRFKQKQYTRYTPRTSSCFPLGTKIWTRTGRRPIETIEVGQGVLSQNPETGELAYRPVLAITTRAPSPLLKVRLHGEDIKTTLGHPMWVVGNGWQMAKQLQAGQHLHSLDGGAEIHSIEPAARAAAVNLVVGQFNTYFVGESGILVHDNTPRQPTRTLLPGLID